MDGEKHDLHLPSSPGMHKRFMITGEAELLIWRIHLRLNFKQGIIREKMHLGNATVKA